MSLKPSAPHGVPVTALFFGNTPSCVDYRLASKVKTVDVHPVLPWVASADEAGVVTVWDYDSSSVVLTFSADSVKDSQRAAHEALDLHAAFAATQDVSVPTGSLPGLGGAAVPVEPGATAGGATEAFLAERFLRRGAGAAGVSALNDDARAGKTGSVRAVKFADEHVLSLECGLTTSAPWVGVDGGVGVDAGSGEDAASLCALTFATSAEDVESVFGGGSSCTPATPSWLIVLCDARALLVDMVTRAIVDVPAASLLIEAPSGGSGGARARVTTRGKPSVHSVALIAPGLLAFGCEDGCVRVWSSDVGAVVQKITVAQSGRPVVSLRVAATAPRSRAGGSSASDEAIAPSCDLGRALANAGTVLLAAGADGVVSSWDVGVGGGLTESARGGATVRLGSDLVDLSLCTRTGVAVALGADKGTIVWDAFSAAKNGFVGGSPKPSRCVTSSAAAEGGAGSRLLAGVPLAAHPFFPPTAILVAGKGPHLEVALPSAPAPQRGPRPEDAIIFYDLRTARAGLPSKLKIYTLARAPSRPDVVVAGTNIGVFVVSVAPAYSAGAAAVTADSWALAPAPLAGAARIRGGLRTLQVSPSGALVGSTVVFATRVTATDVTSGVASGAGSGAASSGAAATAPVLSTSITELISSQAFRPHVPPPAALTPALPGAPPPPPNALAPLAALRAGASFAGTRGVRLRLSPSGRFLAAVWPEHRSYALFKIALQSETAEGALGAWTAAPIEAPNNGVALDVAWSAPGALFDAGDSSPRSVERFAVLAPGTSSAGRGPMGGGSTIGGGTSKPGKAPTSSTHKVTWTPPTLLICEVDFLADAHADISAPRVVAPDIALPSDAEAVALWGGPLLCLATAPEGASAGGTAGAGAATNLTFYGWALAPADSTAERAAPPPSDSRYSGAAAREKKSNLPRLVPAAGAAGGFPPPSVAGAVGGWGVLWSPGGARVAIATERSVTVAAFLRGGGKSAIVAPIGSCAITSVSSLAWVCGGAALAVSYAEARSGARVALLVPPLVDPRGADTDARAAAALRPSGAPLEAQLIDLAADSPGISPISAAVPIVGMPAPARSLVWCAGAAPLAIARGALLCAQWCGLSGVTVVPTPAGAPALRALIAATSAGVDTGAGGGAGAALVAGARNAARLAASTPRASHDAVASLLMRANAAAPALALPGLSLEALLGVALGVRSAVAAPPAPAGAPLPFSALDGAAASGALSSALERASPGALRDLSVHSDASVPGPLIAAAAMLLVRARGRGDERETAPVRAVEALARGLDAAGIVDDARLLRALF